MLNCLGFWKKAQRRPQILPIRRKILQSSMNFEPPDYMFHVFKLVTIWFSECPTQQDMAYERMTI